MENEKINVERNRTDYRKLNCLFCQYAKEKAINSAKIDG